MKYIYMSKAPAHIVNIKQVISITIVVSIMIIERRNLNDKNNVREI